MRSSVGSNFAEALAALEAYGLKPCALDLLKDGTCRFHFVAPQINIYDPPAHDVSNSGGDASDEVPDVSPNRPPHLNSSTAEPLNNVALEPSERSAWTVSGHAEERIHEVVSLYRGSTAFSQLAASTRKEWTPWLDRIDGYFGKLPVEKFRATETIRPIIRRWRSQFSDTPRSADYGMQVFSRVLSYAIDPLGILDANPCVGIKQLYKVDRSSIIWSDSDITKVKVAGSAEIGHAVDLASCTGLRLEDVLRLGWANIAENAIVVATGKSRHKTAAIIPLYDELKALLGQIPRRSKTILTNSRSLPWTKTGFGCSFNKAKIRAGMGDRDLHFHDLRGTAATRFYNAGFSERVISEILGWEEAHVSSISSPVCRSVRCHSSND